MLDALLSGPSSILDSVFGGGKGGIVGGLLEDTPVNQTASSGVSSPYYNNSGINFHSKETGITSTGDSSANPSATTAAPRSEGGMQALPDSNIAWGEVAPLSGNKNLMYIAGGYVLVLLVVLGLVLFGKKK